MKNKVNSLILRLLVIIMLLMTGCSKVTKPSEAVDTQTPVTLTISAAASLTEVMAEIKTIYKVEKPNVTLNYNIAGSGTLQKQIEQGADVDLFFSAGTKQMVALKEKGLLMDDTNVNLVGNSVVLIVKSDSILNISDFKDAADDKVEKIALGEPKTVPVGQYSEEVFKSLNILDKVKSKAVYAKDVKEVLTWVETGNVDTGVVYGTDAKTSDKVKVASIAGDDLYKTPVVYPAAVIKASKNVEGTKIFLKFLSSDKAKEIFIKYGFDSLLK
ncbi:molybdate ABC transporter substrate-binding protein [Clostridium sp.]|jgi:molybdate transport system substrate-binding protein|uniref:molybdate ABC transporter substrate-binding protein n=1 Tax=Clostridium sp. TaxID=1506 RepID=UPI003EEA9647